MKPSQLTQQDIFQIFKLIEHEQESSKLGFFSKPFRIRYQEDPFIIKAYLPKRNMELLRQIAAHHERYVLRMRELEINIPETRIVMRPIGSSTQLLMVQEAFEPEELIRNQMETAEAERYLTLIRLLLDDTLRFWKNKKGDAKVGFHPTSRNYALRQGELYYFDTFPPMRTDQRSLNKLIVQMAPNFPWLKPFIPLQLINMVSDEYYRLDKMLIGIVGSACRLRPELKESVMRFATDYLHGSEQISSQERQFVLEQLAAPPKLPGIWVMVRKMTGNVGKPNVS